LKLTLQLIVLHSFINKCSPCTLSQSQQRHKERPNLLRQLPSISSWRRVADRKCRQLEDILADIAATYCRKLIP